MNFTNCESCWKHHLATTDCEPWCHSSRQTTTTDKFKHLITHLSIDQTVSVKSIKPLFLLASSSFYHHFPPVIASCRPTQQPRPIPGTIDAATIPGSIAIAPPLCRISPGRLQQNEIWSVLGNFDRINMGMNGWTFLFFLNPRQIGSPTETQNKNGGLTVSDGDLCKNKWSKQRRWGFQWSSAKWFDLEEHLQETMDLSHQARGFLSFFPSALLQKRRNTSCHMKRWPTINGPRAYSWAVFTTRLEMASCQFPNFPKNPSWVQNWLLHHGYCY